ncbi:MAG: hypothetical protein UX39_C0008G0008 [Candidatus Magasanikbacteria bacterium GW2011_GWA2_46_17]|uniref:Uncharacterized protein n=1 Tax=Candidatus Magasanikbacteria bacterium GW2011_GWA2_46_17 TaxID=1619042 RepID=A0A0G1RZY9_9BACT|nr:MAG: hypothetical protein UX39_C0008G0008 [Candidatus Magasanikbacteria bacterium GW2011_GWA2_46_17]
MVRVGVIETPPRPWQGRILPLNHTRLNEKHYSSKRNYYKYRRGPNRGFDVCGMSFWGDSKLTASVSLWKGGFSHRFLPTGKTRDPASARRPPAFESPREHAGFSATAAGGFPSRRLDKENPFESPTEPSSWLLSSTKDSLRSLLCSRGDSNPQ